MHVEDHPLEYADFEGDIPAGQYGAGYVELWDRGTYEIVRERPDGTLTVILHGKKLNGEWALVPAKLDGEERNWLIVRAAKEGAAGEPGAYEPMLPREAKRIPSGPEWTFEIAWDGVRALAVLEGARGRFEHDGGDELDERCKQLLGRLPRALRTSECVLDGVICTFDEGVVYVVVDLLDLEAASLIDLPWKDRRKRLDRPARRSRRRGAPLARLRRRPPPCARWRGHRAWAWWPSTTRSPYRPGVESDDWRLLAP